MSNISVPELKARFTIPWLWEHFCLPGEPAKSCRSPFREDRDPSFSVYDDGKKWNDFATGEGGDAIDFVAKVKGCSNADAIKYLKELTGETPSMPEKRKAKKVVTEKERQGQPAPEWLMFPEELSDKDKGIVYCVRAAENLRYNTHLVEQVCGWKHLKKQTVYNLVAEPSIGWLNDRLCFIYTTGLKTRGGLNVSKDQREIRWGWGLPCLWRGFPLMEPCLSQNVKTVWLTEGESDAMCLIDYGVETDDLSTICVALPSASYIPHNLPELLRDKAVILCNDNDEAGDASRKKLLSILRSTVKSLSYFDLDPRQEATAA